MKTINYMGREYQVVFEMGNGKPDGIVSVRAMTMNDNVLMTVTFWWFAELGLDIKMEVDSKSHIEEKLQFIEEVTK